MKILMALLLPLFLVLSGCKESSDKYAESHSNATESRYKPTEKPLDWTKLHNSGTGNEQNEK